MVNGKLARALLGVSTLLAVVDWSVRPGLRLAPLSLPLVVWAAWFLGRIAASGVLAVCLAVWFWQNGHGVSHLPLLIEDTAAAGMFLGLAFLTAALRRELETAWRQSRQDPLTGLANRRAFHERASAELSRAGRFGRPITLIILDCDQLKMINDQEGHAAGDRLLQDTANVLRACVRHYDVVARLAGDEFAILLPDTDPQAARAVGTRLQADLQSVRSTAGQPVTFSVGVITSTSAKASIEDLHARADRLMYSVKHSGKNGVAFEAFVGDADDHRPEADGR